MGRSPTPRDFTQAQLPFSQRLHGNYMWVYNLTFSNGDVVSKY